MSDDVNSEDRNDMSLRDKLDEDVSPVKALFRGEIVQSALWPFPEIDSEQRELLDMVLDSVDRFLADQQENFAGWDRSSEQPKAFVDDLRDDALIFEKYTLELARMTDVLLRRHGKAIVDRQFALERAANVAIDLFVGLCVLSRVSTMASEDTKQYKQALSIAHLFSQQAKRRMNRNLRAMLHNEDDSAKSLATYVYEVEGYPWDTN